MLQQPISHTLQLKHSHHTLSLQERLLKKHYQTLFNKKMRLPNTTQSHEGSLPTLKKPLHILALLDNLAELATHNSIQLQSINPLKEKHTRHETINPLTLSFTGNYFSIMQFIHQLIQLPYILTFSNITFVPLSSSQIECSLKIQVYTHE